MYQCPNCRYTNAKKDTVYKHFKRTHTDVELVRGSILQIQVPIPQPVINPDEQLPIPQVQAVIQPIPALEKVGDSAQQIITDIPAPIPHNNDMEELQNSIRTFRLSNDGLSLLLERSQAQLVTANARVTHLEEFSNELTLRLGNAVDLNSQLLVSEFERMSQRQEIDLYTISLGDKDSIIQNLTNQIQEMQLKELTMITIVAADQKYEAEREASNAQITDLTSRLKISESNCVQMRQKCELIEDAKQQLINQHTTKYQAVVERLDCAEKAMIEAQKVIVQSMGQVALLESSIEKLEIENVGYILTAEENNEDNLEKNSLLRQQLSDAQQAIVQKKTEYDLSLEEKMALIRQNDKTISLLQERVTMLEGKLTKNIEENEGLQNDKQHLATQISHLVDAKLSLEGKLGQCEKDLYSKDEELASLRSKVIELENSNRYEMNLLANTKESTDSRMNAVSDVEPPDRLTDDDEDPIQGFHLGR